MPTGGRQKMTDGAEKTISVPEAGRRYFDLCRGASYEAAKQGDIPKIRIGRLLRVPVRVLERMLDSAGEHVRNNGAEALAPLQLVARKSVKTDSWGKGPAAE